MADEDVSDEDDSSDIESKPATDLCQLFGDSATLRTAASKVKEKIPENVILQHNSHILQWLESRQERQEDSISMAQFCEMLMDKGVERLDAIKAFHQFDCDGSGVADVQTMIETLEHFSSRSGLGELGKSVRILQSCSLTPGFVDVYGGLTDPVEKHGKRIQQYLHRNRTETQSLPFPYLNSFNIVQVMRSAVLKSILHAAKEDVKNMDSDKDSTEMERFTTHNCYSSIEVSSNVTEAHHLRHNAMFWQSDGAARSHWIRLRMKSNIIVKHLSIGVSSSDESYMPELVTISVGSTPTKLREIKDIKVEKHYSGRVVLLRNMKVHYPYIQINIKRCHVDGCDTRIHGIKAIGYKLVKEQGITVMDASALWYLQMLTSTINFNLPQSPMLRNTLLGQTKKALEFMPPLVLSPSSPEKPVFLSKYVLQEIETFAHQLSFSPDVPEQLSEEGIQVVLALNLARGSVSALINLLSGIIELPTLSLSCADLLCKAISAKNSCLEKLGVPVPVSFVGGDGGPGQTNAGPDVLVDSSGSNSGKTTSSSSGYVTDEGKTKCTLVFKSDQLVQLTKIRIQVTSGSKGAKRGLVFVYNADSIPELNSKFDADEHISYLSKYDFWREKEFEFSVQYRNSGLGGLPDNPVAYFCFDTDSDEIDVPTQWGAVGKYIIVKFLEPRHETATRIGIVSLKFFGLTKPVALDYSNQKPLAIPDSEKKETCDLPDICSLVLTFVTEIASEQVKRLKGAGLKTQTDFLDLSELNLTQLWDLHLDCEKRADKESGKPADMWQRSSVLALQLIHGLIPMLAVSKNTSETSRDSLFQQLCTITNSQTPETTETLTPYMANKLKMVKQIIVDGAPLFFPEKSRKRLELFKLLQTVSDQSSKPSISLVFQSLCQFFSSVDPRGLLELPNELTPDFSISSTLELMKSLLSVACQEMQRMKLEVSANMKQRAKLAQKEAEDKNQATTNKEPEATEENDCKSRPHETGNNTNTSGENSSTAGATTSTSTEKKSKENTRTSEEAASESSSVKAECDKLEPKEAGEPNAEETTKKADGVVVAKTEVKGGGEGAKSAAAAPLDAEDDKENEEEGRMVYLVMLAASLQTSLFSWLWQQLETKSVADDKKLSCTVQTMIKEYTQDVADKAHQFFEIFRTMSPEDMQAKALKKEPSFLNIITRQLLLLLTTVVDKLDIETKVALLQSFKKLIITASDVAKANPDIFLDINSECWDKVDTEETILRTWEVESPHEYQNHSNIVQVFNCPGASKLVVDFDPRCETERRYDYLEFTDSKGLKLHFDQKVGTAKWPLKVTFSGPYVHFIFHSDSSNTEWGYKFTVTAHGTPDTQNSWLSDLHLGLVKVLGQLSGATLSSNPIVPQECQMVGEESSEHDILRSNLWTSLFRGGYMVGKLERTLSGKFATSDDSRAHALLTEIVNVAAQRQPEAEEEGNDILQKQATRLLSKCRETKAKTQVRIGGIKVDEAVTSLFAALVWHCQALREDLEKFFSAQLMSALLNTTDSKMATPIKGWSKLEVRAVARFFLFSKQLRPSEIHKQIAKTYGEVLWQDLECINDVPGLEKADEVKMMSQSLIARKHRLMRRTQLVLTSSSNVTGG
ncbi:zinc finger ZZ-type and EF-hand domain-containing protein 1-like [Elysia marginata]|uniref:Zinc finger ZZ-type and EF-hand domain-containing protein 1-like n=1 Tax=Elysia marginata TaxID=1093978 RepID=A0AAV4IDF4_9GAST|nr:zinc finger ZZ-type and EF-hand domain-containing protein 1-like [Elysia marginata]